MRFLLPLLLVPLADRLAAQCAVTTGGVSAGLVAVGTNPANDEGVSPPIALGFAFPLGAATYSHVVADSNGVLYLTNGGLAAGRVLYGPASVANLRGQPGDSPRVFPLWTDLEGASSWAVNVDLSIAGRCKVIWVRVREFFSVGQGAFSFSATLDASGVVEFAYGTLPALPNWVTYAAIGISAGNNVGTGGEPSNNLIAGADSGTVPLLYEELIGVTPNESGSALLLVPNGGGGYTSFATCRPGAHTKLGAGCYADSFYQILPDASAASAQLSGNALHVAPTATGYTATWLPGGASAFVPPIGATAFPRGDDDQYLLDLAANGLPSFPAPTGATSKLWVHANGFVSTSGATNDNGTWNTPFANDYRPSERFRLAPETAFWAWHDWEPSDLTGGAIVWHYDPTPNVLYVTWDGVENHSILPVANPGTFQFQFHLATGEVDYVWLAVDGDTTSPRGSAHLVGYSPGGTSIDPGQLPLATIGGTTTITTAQPMTLTASPAPQILAGGTSNPITYTVGQMPDFAPPTGTRVGFLVFSFAPLPGVDLGFLGAPACGLYVLNLDVLFPISIVGAVAQSVTVTYPAPLASGATFVSQALAFLPPGVLGGGSNAFGMLTSNGLLTSF